MKLTGIFLLVLMLFSCNKKVQVVKTISNEIVENDKEIFVKNFVDSVISIKRFISPYKFTDFKAAVFSGKLVAPDFKGDEFANDPEYVDYIIDGCKQGINFGGKYTIVQMSCGAMCEHLTLVDRTTGRISVGPVGIEIGGDGRYGYIYKKDSRMIIADSGFFTDGSMKYYAVEFNNGPSQSYVWKANRFKLLK